MEPEVQPISMDSASIFYLPNQIESIKIYNMNTYI